MKNPIILTLILIGFTVVFSFIIALIGVLVGAELYVPGLAGVLGALTLRAIYLRANKEIVPVKTKLTIVIIYFALQQVMGIIITLIRGVDILVTLGFQLLIQLIYAGVIYLCLSGGKKLVKRLKK